VATGYRDPYHKFFDWLSYFTVVKPIFWRQIWSLCTLPPSTGPATPCEHTVVLVCFPFVIEWVSQRRVLRFRVFLAENVMSPLAILRTTPPPSVPTSPNFLYPCPQQFHDDVKRGLPCFFPTTPHGSTTHQVAFCS